MKNENQNNINNSNNIIEKPSIKIKYIKEFLKTYENLNKKTLKSIDEVIQLKNKSIHNNLNDEEEKVFLITNKIIEKYQNILSNYQKLFENIISKLTNYLNDYNQLQIKYTNFEEINKLYNQKKKRITELKNDYHQNGKEFEQCVITKFEENKINSDESDKLIYKVKESLNKYKMEVTDINKCIIEYNKKQKDLMEIYTKFNKIILYDSIKEEFNKNFEHNLKIISSTVLDINISNKINQKIEDNKNNNFNKFKNLENESIIHFPSSIKFDECSDENDYLLYVKTIKYIKNAIDDQTLYNDFDEEKEIIRNKNRKIIISFFDDKNNLEITDENKKELINILREPSIHNIFLIIMSRFRTHSERSKNWINLMGECLNIILNVSLKDNDYDKIRDSLVLSQTFYYIEENNNQKIYIYNMIEDKQFFNDYNFWKKLIDTMILKQLKLYLINNNLTGIDLVKGEGLTPNLIKKLGDLLFTQLLPYVNNMINFKIDKNKIVNIVDYFKTKYIYLTQQNYETIISMINSE